ncbi:MAG: 50S ribosomal protein L23 [Oscillospiraceae bacterium]|nr:50S ribosomal protein L23 [Oscillospiraceae bacterium]
MRLAEDIIISPLITEKSNDQIADGKYTFIVDVHATKTEIRHAVEKLFTVKVISVNTCNYNGKIKRMGVHIGPRPDWKKAVVKIDVSPGVQSYMEKGGRVASTSRRYKSNIEEFGVMQ